MILDWQHQLTKLKAKDGSQSSSEICALISCMYQANRLIKNLNEKGYELELGLINKSNIFTNS